MNPATPPATDLNRTRRATRCALGSALLFVAAFRPLHLYLLVWVALIPLLHAAQGRAARTRFRLGFLFGLVAFGGVFYWLPIATYNARWVLGKSDFGGALLALLAWAAFVAYSALFTALATTLGLTAASASSASAPIRFACAWTLCEWLRSLPPFGFEWAQLGFSQTPWLALLQNCDVAGVLGLSGLIALFNSVWCGGGAAMKWMRPLVVAVIVAAVARGAARLMSSDDRARPGVSIAVIQPAIPNREKLDPKRGNGNLPILEELTEQAARTSELILWPESMLPTSWTMNAAARRQLLELTRVIGKQVLVGSNDREREGAPLYNRMVLLTPAGERGESAKRRLVAFGEYVPLRGWLPLADRLGPSSADYTPGPEPLPLRTTAGRMGVLVCFDSTFAECARKLARRGAEFFAVPTNDDWFRGTTAVQDHVDSAIVRAIETRRWVARAANTGESVFVRPNGEVAARLPFARRGVLTYTISRQQEQTLAVRWGSWLPLLCALMLAALAAAPRNRRNAEVSAR